MSERKVLNKYYPADYDPSKIPRMKGEKSKQFAIRVMAPFNMRCDSCGEYIYKGTKFNSRMENVEGESYLGIPIRRFYFKCTRCVSEITFKTDPESVDYVPEHGATRLFEALRTAEKMAEAEEQRIADEEANNPMKQLEKRTTASQREIEMLETLEELKELNARHASVNHEALIEKNLSAEKMDAKLLEALAVEEDERIVREAFGKRGHQSSSDEDDSDNNNGEKEEQQKVAILSWKRTKQSHTSTSAGADFAVPAPIVKKTEFGIRKVQPNLGIAKPQQRKTADEATQNAHGTSSSSTKPASSLLSLQYSSSSSDENDG